jgi:endonuclease/exonuclease/phosphatase family metal-dependent hydrolase
MLLGFGYKFLTRTYALNFKPYKEGAFQVLNYNVRVFNSYDHLKDEGYNSSKKMIKWVSDDEADIKCLQEVYNDGTSKIFNSVNQIKINNPFFYYQPYLTVEKVHTFGLAILSKHKIINKGQIRFQKETFNQAIFADIKYKEDTIRIYNVHLQSMSIDESSLYQDSASSNSFKVLFRKLKKGALARSLQVKLLLEHMEKCPYKIFISGDFNDTPYSYTYEAFRKNLYNAFEEKGEGFGFTYNGKLFFLRIDNIFSDKSIEVNTFKTYKDITYSDHYPIKGTYTFK